MSFIIFFKKLFKNNVYIFFHYYFKTLLLNIHSFLLFCIDKVFPSSQDDAVVITVQSDSDDCIMCFRVKCSGLPVLRTLGCSSCSQQLNNPPLLIRSCVLADSASLSAPLSDSLPVNYGTHVLVVAPVLVWNRKCCFIIGWVGSSR